MFAKLFEVESIGQILVKLDSGDGDTEAEVRFYVEPPNLGVCSVAAGFNDRDKAQEMFDKIDESAAVEAAQSLLTTCANFAPTGEDK